MNPILLDLWFFLLGMVYIFIGLCVLSVVYYAIEFVAKIVRNFVNKHKEVPHVR